MTLDEWVKSAGPEVVLSHAWKRGATRKRRLFVCACLRASWDILPAKLRATVEVVEQFVDGIVGADTLDRARYWAEGFTLGVEEERSERREHAETLVRNAGWSDDEPAPTREDIEKERNRRVRVVNAAHVAEWVASNPLESRDPRWFCGMYNGELVGEIFGNPFRPATFDRMWRTDTAIALARGMYESRDFGAMPILADALQDAGCTSDDILDHLRDPHATHVRGCWVIDLVLGKS